MFRKMMFALCIIVTLSLLGSGLTLASEGLPTWEIAFDPGPFMPEPYYFIHAVEEFKGDLYTVVGDPIWFNSDDGRDSAGQVFRSPDGKNWEPASDLGFGLGAVEDGCGNNYYDTSQDMVVFKNKLYLIPSEICYLRPGVILRSRNGVTWESVATTEEFGKTWTFDVDYYGQFYKLAAFKGMLYVNLVYYDPNTEFVASAIFRSPSGNPGTWEQLMEFPGWNRPGSFHVFKDALYVASDNVISLPDWAEAPEQIWRSFDGVNWEKVVGDGFGYSPVDGLGGFADYKGYLYVGTGTIDTSSGLIGQLWRSRDGQHWKQVDISSLLSQNDVKVDGGFVYHGKLYIYTVNYIEGGSVFRTKDAKTWERVNEPGWGNPTWLTTHLASDQVVFKDDLYMGVVGPQGVLLKMLHPDK